MKISMITITLNSEATIEQTILSVLGQNYKNLEYIIIDGGSTDKTLEIVNKYSNRITKLISEKDNGISDAFNKGISLCTGDLIGIINSDDYLAEDALDTVAKNIKKETEVLYGNVVVLSTNNEINYVVRGNENLETLLYFMKSILHPACFIRKSAYDKYGMYDLGYRCCMDRELLLRMYINKANFQYINYELAWFRVGGFSEKMSLVQQKESKEISYKYGASKLRKFSYDLYFQIRKSARSFIKYCGIEEYVLRIFKK